MAEISGQVISSIGSLTDEFKTIAHNLANVSTAGYKRRVGSFASTLEQRYMQEESEQEEVGELVTELDFSQGNLFETGRNLDLALHGKGFFVIETPEGPLYTRNGVFHINQNSQLVDSEGRTVAGEAGAISVPNNITDSQLSVSTDGAIRAGEATIGKFRLVDFGENENKLESAGLNCFYMPVKEIVPVAANGVVVKQGFLESSNVQIIHELVNMIMVSRLYEANMKLISTSGDATKSLLSAAMG